MKGDKNILEISFACFTATIFYYSLFGKFLKRSSPHLQVLHNTSNYIGKTHYGWYIKLIESPCKDSDLDYNENYINMDFQENARDKKDDSAVKENAGRDGKNSLRDGKDDSIVREKNRRKNKVTNDNNTLLDLDLNDFLDLVMQLNLGKIAD